MHTHVRSGFILAAAAAALMSSAALAQTVQPSTTVTATTATVSATNWMTQETAGQWRASKMVGLNVYNSNNEKIGDIAELIVDQSGKLEAVVIGAGGFLGIDQRDVAVPFGQINWVFQPMPSSRVNNSTIPYTTGAGAGTAPIRNDGPRSYPDHAVLNMTKDQLKAAPAFKFSR
jgi:sporulation protein YlmC with PRC-barrel domain